MTEYRVQAMVEMASVDITVYADSEQEAADKAKTALEGGNAVINWNGDIQGTVGIDEVSRISVEEA